MPSCCGLLPEVPHQQGHGVDHESRQAALHRHDPGGAAQPEPEHLRRRGRHPLHRHRHRPALLLAAAKEKDECAEGHRHCGRAGRGRFRHHRPDRRSAADPHFAVRPAAGAGNAVPAAVQLCGHDHRGALHRHRCVGRGGHDSRCGPAAAAHPHPGGAAGECRALHPHHLPGHPGDGAVQRFVHRSAQSGRLEASVTRCRASATAYRPSSPAWASSSAAPSAAGWPCTSWAISASASRTPSPGALPCATACSWSHGC